MGDRFILTVVCPVCGYRDDSAYYAPTCGFMTWKCRTCGHKVDLRKYTGIDAEQASNKAALEQIVSNMVRNCT